MIQKQKGPGKFAGAFLWTLYDRGLATEGNTVRYIVNHVAVQANVSQFARIKFAQRNLGLVLNAQCAKESKNLGYDHFITYFKPADLFGMSLFN
ncbi:hypothetical protein LPB41_14655 [Thalassospira sp. MA62]|nr:hypothetical protein [Thalassospira sp. MA62]